VSLLGTSFSLPLTSWLHHVLSSVSVISASRGSNLSRRNSPLAERPCPKVIRSSDKSTLKFTWCSSSSAADGTMHAAGYCDGPSTDREVGAVRSNLRHPVLPCKSLLAPSGCNLGSTYKPPRQIQVSDRFVTLPAPRARVLVKCRPTRAHPPADAAGRDPDRTACTHGSLGDTAWLPSASCSFSHSFTPWLAGGKATVFVKVPWSRPMQRYKGRNYQTRGLDRPGPAHSGPRCTRPRTVTRVRPGQFYPRAATTCGQRLCGTCYMPMLRLCCCASSVFTQYYRAGVKQEARRAAVPPVYHATPPSIPQQAPTAVGLVVGSAAADLSVSRWTAIALFGTRGEPRGVLFFNKKIKNSDLSGGDAGYAARLVARQEEEGGRNHVDVAAPGGNTAPVLMPCLVDAAVCACPCGKAKQAQAKWVWPVGALRFLSFCVRWKDENGSGHLHG